MEFFDTQNPTVLVMLVALSMALVRVIERLVEHGWSKRKNGKKSINPAPATGGCNGLTPEEHAALIRLDELHAQRDEDGIPLWYTPRSLLKTMDKQTDILDKLAVRQRDTKQLQHDTLGLLRRWETESKPFVVPQRKE